MKECCECFVKEYENTSKERFRSRNTVTTQLFILWEIMNGNFAPVSADHYGFSASITASGLPALADKTADPSVRCICINDTDDADEDFDAIKKEVRQLLNNKLPEKCRFEQ